MGLIDDERELSERDRAGFHHHVFDADDLRGARRARPDSASSSSGGYFVKPFTHRQMERDRRAC